MSLLSTAYLVLAALFAGFTSAGDDQGRDGHGLIGYGIKMYNPPCAFACRAAISSAPLNCSTYEGEMSHGMAGMSMSDHEMATTSVECYASDDLFLQTLAWCISTRCQDIPTWELEKYWSLNEPGNKQGQPDPRLTYQQALSKVSTPPTKLFSAMDALNTTAVVPESVHQAQMQTLFTFETNESTHERYGLVLLLSGFVIPLAASLLRFLPFPRRIVASFNAYFSYPSTFGLRHSQPLPYNIGNVPTRGQAFFIAYLILINVILSCAGYKSTQPNTWYSDSKGEITTYVANRLGVLSFANLPLLVLYSGRNNILLWVTNFSHTTFLLLHRWVARLCMLQAVLHSAMYLQIYVVANSHTEESKLPYWYWGVIGTLALALLIPFSILPLRQRLYEVFLLSHIALSVLALVGCYYHIIFRFQTHWGYENWIYVACAVWGFDRVLRVLRTARNGVRRAQITIIDEDYLRIDIRGVKAAGHAYLYFPTLTWRVWENHPFSIASSISRIPSKSVTDLSLPLLVEGKEDGIISAQPLSSDITPRSYSQEGNKDTLDTHELELSFLVRTLAGGTSPLRQRKTIPVLVESSYGAHPDLSAYTKVVCIAGGVGISAVLPITRSFSGQVKLFWGVRTRGLVSSLEPELSGVDHEVFIGERMDVNAVLASIPGDFAVVVSGPPSMADDVRLAVSRLAKEKDVVLFDEVFAW